MKSKRKPTLEQSNALRAYAARKGRNWKQALNIAWVTGRDAQEPEGALLRQVRNELGPVWLSSCNLKTDLTPAEDAERAKELRKRQMIADHMDRTIALCLQSS